jgi:hypothetical protein
MAAAVEAAVAARPAALLQGTLGAATALPHSPHRTPPTPPPTAPRLPPPPQFDPYFNYRVTQFLTKEGVYSMWDW